MRWFQRQRPSAQDGRAGCPHCGALLEVCAVCGGRFDTGLLCQECMRGLQCPRCRRYWTWA